MKLPSIFLKSPLDQARRALAEAEGIEAAAAALLASTPADSPRGKHARRRLTAAQQLSKARRIELALASVVDAEPRARKIAQQAHSSAVAAHQAAREHRDQLGASLAALDRRADETRQAQVQQLEGHRIELEAARARLAAAVEGLDADEEVKAARAVEQVLRQSPESVDSAPQIQIAAINARRGKVAEEISAADAAVTASNATLAGAVGDLFGIARDLANIAAMRAAVEYAVLSGESFEDRSAVAGDVYCIGRSSLLFSEAGESARWLVDKHGAHRLNDLATNLLPIWAEVLAVDPQSFSAEPPPPSPPARAGVYASHAAIQHFGDRAEGAR